MIETLFNIYKSYITVPRPEEFQIYTTSELRLIVYFKCKLETVKQWPIQTFSGGGGGGGQGIFQPLQITTRSRTCPASSVNAVGPVTR